MNKDLWIKTRVEVKLSFFDRIKILFKGKMIIRIDLENQLVNEKTLELVDNHGLLIDNISTTSQLVIGGLNDRD